VGIDLDPGDLRLVGEIISTLVLCTVEDPDQVVAEVRRVLRPGGLFRFVEHVAAPTRGPRWLVQWLVSRPWGWLFDGCDPHPDTIAVLERAGFADLRIERRKFTGSPFWPVKPSGASPPGEARHRPPSATRTSATPSMIERLDRPCAMRLKVEHPAST
jgi:SAM-dependent methyltransferase